MTVIIFFSFIGPFFCQTLQLQFFLFSLLFGLRYTVLHYITSTVTKRLRKSCKIRCKCYERYLKHFTRFRFWTVRNRCTHFADSFYMFKCWCNRLGTCSFEMLTALAISSNFIHPSSNYGFN